MDYLTQNQTEYEIALRVIRIEIAEGCYENLITNLPDIDFDLDDFKETYYIPAGRSMITLLVNNRSLIENENLDLITRQFMQIIDSIHVAFADGIRNVHKRYPDKEEIVTTNSK